MEQIKINKLKGILKTKFNEGAKKVWKNYEKANPTLKFEIAKMNEKDTLASVNYKRNARPRNVGRFLVQIPKEIKVVAREDLFQKDKEYLKKIILHEVIHLGISGHGKEFEKIAKEVGTFSTENLIGGGGFSVQQKIGSRFKTIKKFPEKQLAWDYANELFKKTNKKVRLQY